MKGFRWGDCCSSIDFSQRHYLCLVVCMRVFHVYLRLLFLVSEIGFALRSTKSRCRYRVVNMGR